MPFLPFWPRHDEFHSIWIVAKRRREMLREIQVHKHSIVRRLPSRGKIVNRLRPTNCGTEKVIFHLATEKLLQMMTRRTGARLNYVKIRRIDVRKRNGGRKCQEENRVSVWCNKQRYFTESHKTHQAFPSLLHFLCKRHNIITFLKARAKQTTKWQNDSEKIFAVNFNGLWSVDGCYNRL